MSAGPRHRGGRPASRVFRFASRGRGIALGVLSQGLFSLTNFVLGITVARWASTDDFGAFSIVYGGFVLVQGLGRAFISEPYASRWAWQEERHRSGARSAALGLVVPFAALGAAATAVAGLALGLGAASSAALAGGTAAALLQDVVRVQFITEGRPVTAVWMDAAWLAAQAALLVVVASGGLTEPSASGAILAWAVGAILSLVLGAVVRPVVPHVAHGWRSLRTDWRRSLSFTADFGLGMAAYQLALWVVAAGSGIAAVAALRGADVALGPATTVMQATRVVLLPRFGQRHRSQHDLRWPQLVAAGSVMAVGLGWGAVLLLDPWNLGEAMLGETWEATRAVLPAMVLMRATLGGSSVFMVGLLAAERSRAAVVARSTSAAAVLGGCVAGGVWDGASGAAWGLAAAGVLSLAITALIGMGPRAGRAAPDRRGATTPSPEADRPAV